MIRRSVLGLISLGLGACSPELESIAAPDLTRFASLLIAVQAEGALRVEAHVLPMPEGFRVEADGDLELRLLAYTSSLAALGLPEGPLRIDSTGELLPPPDQIFRAALAAPSADWSEERALTEPLASARFAREPSSCAELERLTLTLPSTASVMGLFPIDDHAVIAALVDGQIFRIAPEEVTPLRALEGDASIRAAARAEDGSIWIADSAGRISRISPDLVARRTIDTVRFSHETISLGVRAGPPLEIYSSDPFADIERSDGVQLTRLGRVGQETTQGHGRHFLSLGPSDVLILDRGTEIWRIRGSTVTFSFPEWATPDSRPGTGAFLELAGVGVVVVANHNTQGTALFRHAPDGTWPLLYGPENEHLFWRAWIAQDLGAGEILLAGQQGFASVLNLERGVCDDLNPGPRHWDHSAKAGRDVVLAGNLIESSDVPTSVVWLRRR